LRQRAIDFLVGLLLRLEQQERDRGAAFQEVLRLLEEGQESEQEKEEDPEVPLENSPEYHSPVAEDTDPVPNSVRVGQWRISPAHRWDELSDAQKDVFKQGLEEIRRRMPRQ